MKVVLDTNVLLVSIPRKSPYRRIFDSLIDGSVSLVISNEILSEYEEIITKKTNQTIAHNILEMLLSLPNVERVEIFYRWRLIETDADDNKFSDAAIVGNVDYIVTNDSHFDRLKTIEFPILKAITISEFLEKLNSL